MMNLVTGCRRYNCRCHGANCRDRRCRKRSSGNSTFGSHFRCRCSGRERDSWCSLRLCGQSCRHRSGLCKPKLLKRLTTVRWSRNKFRIKDSIHLLKITRKNLAICSSITKYLSSKQTKLPCVTVDDREEFKCKILLHRYRQIVARIAALSELDWSL